MKKTDMNAILALNTNDKYNQLSQDEKIALVTDITEKFGGVTLTEHIGGCHMDNGMNAVEYSYTFELFNVDQQQARDYFITLGQQNNQESIILNKEFIYM